MKAFNYEDVTEFTIGTYRCIVRLVNNKQLRIPTRTVIGELEKRNLSFAQADLNTLLPNATIKTNNKVYSPEELRKKCRREKYLVSVIVLILIGITIGYLFVGCSIKDHNLSNYPTKAEYVADYASKYMPELDSLLASESITFEDKTFQWVIFLSHSIQLVVQYDEQAFETEKNRINSEYKFLTQATQGQYGDYTISAPEFDLNDFHFRIIQSPKDAALGYPKEIGMIAISDKDNTIAYLFYYNDELDYIDKEKSIDAMAVFVIDNFSPFWE